VQQGLSAVRTQDLSSKNIPQARVQHTLHGARPSSGNVHAVKTHAAICTDCTILPLLRTCVLLAHTAFCLAQQWTWHFVDSDGPPLDITGNIEKLGSANAVCVSRLHIEQQCFSWTLTEANQGQRAGKSNQLHLASLSTWCCPSRTWSPCCMQQEHTASRCTPSFNTSKVHVLSPDVTHTGMVGRVSTGLPARLLAFVSTVLRC
jgi:hypothetical protein